MTETEAAQTYARQVGQRVREARKAAGLTQAELGAHFERSSSYVSDCELGNQAFAVSDLFVAALVLKKSVQHFTKRYPAGNSRAA